MTSASAFAARNASGTGSGHVGDLAAGVMGAVEICLQVLFGPRPCELHDARVQFERSGETVFTHIEHQKVQADRFIGLLTDSCSTLLWICCGVR